MTEIVKWHCNVVRIANVRYKSNEYFSFLPLCFDSALHGSIKYEDDIILLNAHVYLMVLHDLKSFIFSIRQKKVQSETRTQWRKGHYLDLNPYKRIPHCAWENTLLFHFNVKFSMWFLYEVLIGMACRNKQHCLRPEFITALKVQPTTGEVNFCTKTVSKKARCAAL